MTTRQKSIFENEYLVFTLELILSIPVLAVCTPVGWLVSLCVYLCL